MANSKTVGLTDQISVKLATKDRAAFHRLCIASGHESAALIRSIVARLVTATDWREFSTRCAAVLEAAGDFDMLEAAEPSPPAEAPSAAPKPAPPQKR